MVRLMITETKVRTRQLEASHAGASRYQESDQAILEKDQRKIEISQIQSRQEPSRPGAELS